MKKLLLSLAVAATFLAGNARAADMTPAPLSDAQKTQIEQVVKDLLVREPELVMQAAQRMQQRDQQKQLDMAKTGIKDHQKDLFDDKGSPAFGASAKDADVTIVEFFDFNCGYCKKSHPVVSQLMAEDKKIRIIYKQFPILGPTSLTGAQYAVAAAKQGKYKEFHDALLDSHEPVSQDGLDKLAASLKLDMDKLKKDAAGDETKKRISDDLELGKAVGVQGTPGFVIGDKLYPGAMDLATMKQVVADTRAKK